jgi:hypothetical protein
MKRETAFPKSMAVCVGSIITRVKFRCDFKAPRRLQQTICTEISASGRQRYDAGFDFGLLFLSVHFLFGGAKRKWTALF